MEWEVFLDDGSTLNSRSHRWEDIPDRVIVLKVWEPTRKILLWGLSHYGRPDTLKAGVDIADAEFRRILELARGNNNAPSQR